MGKEWPIIVNGKKKLKVPVRYVPGYIIHIWGRAKEGEQVIQKCPEVDIEVQRNDTPDLNISCYFEVINKKYN